MNSLPVESFLLTIVQVSLGITGFTAVIATFRRQGQEWTENDEFGLKFMVEFGLLGVFISFFPILLFWLKTDLIPTVDIWRISSGTFLILLIYELWQKTCQVEHFSLRWLQFLHRNKSLKLMPSRRPGVANVMLILSIVITFLQMVNILPERNAISAFFLCGVVGGLLVACLQAYIMLYPNDKLERGIDNTEKESNLSQ